MKNLKLLLIESLLSVNYDIPSNKIVGVYSFGSSTYGTQTENSDSDFVIIVDMEQDYIQHESKTVDMHIMSIDYFKKKLNDHDIMALEAYFNPNPIKKFETDFELNLVKLRHQISSVVSNSWVKAKKKVSLENEDSWVGWKSLFHSLRILEFGNQIAKNGKITDYTCMVPLWVEIISFVQQDKDIKEIMDFYKPKYNANRTEFRKLAPKK